MDINALASRLDWLSTQIVENDTTRHTDLHLAESDPPRQAVDGSPS